MKQREIDLRDMIVDILFHWKGLLVIMIVGAVLMGGLSYVRSYRNVQQSAQVVEETKLDQATVEKTLAEIEDTMNDSEKADVLTTLDDEREYFYKEKYIQESAYMQLNPLSIAQTELVYKVQAQDEHLVQQLGLIYEDLIDNVGLYKWVEQQTGLTSAYVGELVDVKKSSEISFKNNDQKVNFESAFESNSLKITIMQADEETCNQLTDAVKNYIEQLQKKLVTEMGEHTLSLLSETSGNIMDVDVMDRQVLYRNDVSNGRTAIATAKSKFTEEQQKYYDLLTWEDRIEEEEIKPKEATEELATVATPSVSKKYILLGAILFAFGYVVVLAFAYIFDSKLRASDELQNLYHIPQIGVIVKDSEKEFIVDKWIDVLRHYGKRKFSVEQSMELAFAAVKIAAVKNGLDSICLMGCNLSAGAGNVCENLKVALEKEGITVTILDNVLYNAEMMEKVDAVSGVVLVEKAGSTLYNEIAKELELLKRQEITVLGGIIVE